jgi:hypothetical protein
LFLQIQQEASMRSIHSRFVSVVVLALVSASLAGPAMARTGGPGAGGSSGGGSSSGGGGSGAPKFTAAVLREQNLPAREQIKDYSCAYDHSGSFGWAPGERACRDVQE